MSYLQVDSGSWLHIVKQRQKPARCWWKIIEKKTEDLSRDKLKISLLQTLYIFGRILWYYSELRNARFMNCLGTYYISCLFYF